MPPSLLTRIAPWSLSWAGYYADLVAAPIAAVGLLVLAWRVIGGWSLPVAALGVVAWTFAEYWLHRSWFHGPARALHDAHHNAPAAYIGVPWYGTALTFTALVGSLWLLIGAAGLALAAGITAGYEWYLVVHDRIHHGAGAPRNEYLRERARLHRVHHAGVERHFGIVTSFWDRVYGTNRATFKRA